MKYPLYIEKYLKKNSRGPWTLSFVPDRGFEAVIVIPALAERDHLFQALLSLAENRNYDLGSVLVICVINNGPAGIASEDDINNNAETMRYLDYFTSSDGNSPVPERILSCREAEKIRKSGLGIAYVDASSKGKELPPKSGVGLARKIGMDLALTVFDYERGGQRLIVCLDADTLTDKNYLSQISRYFRENKSEAAVVSFEHKITGESRHVSAIACYEIFLRYYRLGLAYTGTPYAFHTIGSTMVCTAKSYSAIRGMNTKEAGEDFYFLQKLAKYTPIVDIKDAVVYPSARISDRVPFGTGRKMREMAAAHEAFFPFYHPRSFQVLRDFLTMIKEAIDEDVSEGDTLVEASRKIDPLLAEFLVAKKIDHVWGKLVKNSSCKEKLMRSFHEWFDAFAILKFVHYARDYGYPEINMFQAVGRLMEMMNIDFLFDRSEMEHSEKGVALLDFMRRLERD